MTVNSDIRVFIPFVSRLSCQTHARRRNGEADVLRTLSTNRTLGAQNVARQSSNARDGFKSRGPFKLACRCVVIKNIALVVLALLSG